MKKIIGLAALLLLAGSVASAGQLSFKVGGGMAFVNGNDYNKGITGFMAYVNDNFTGVSGEIKKMTNALDFQGELIFSFTPQIGVGIGAGYYGLSRNDTLKFEAIGIVDTINYSPRLSAIPIFINLHYFLQASSMLKLDLFAGPLLVIASLDWKDSDTWALWDLEHTFKANGTAFGFQAGLGLDVRLASKISLVLDVFYRLASWSEVKGTWTESGWALFWTVDDSYEDSYLWSYRYTSGGKTYDWVSLGPNQPSGTGYNGVKKSPLNLGGLAATIGFKIGL